MRALLSVADRDGITDLARDLLDLGVEVFATDGTREWLAADGVEVESDQRPDRAPPLIGGQVKTFHPEIYAGILARRNVPADLASLAEHGIGLIDIVVVNVNPFAPQVGERARAHRRSARDDRRRGRGAAHRRRPQLRRGRGGLSHPAHYPQLVEELRDRGHVSPETPPAPGCAGVRGRVAAY